MQVNIKSAEASDLIDRLTELTGESKTRAVIESLRLRVTTLERQTDVQRRVTEVNRLVDELRAKLPTKLPTQAELDASFFDEDGLPK